MLVKIITWPAIYIIDWYKTKKRLQEIRKKDPFIYK